jgi:N-acetylmuramoyl-L-alanine amidase
MSCRLSSQSLGVLLPACLLFAFGCAISPLKGTAPSSMISPPRAYPAPLLGFVRTIVIDAGHGAHDPGTTHFGLKEKHLALDIAKRLRADLQDEGFTVVMTRETDKFIPLSGRPAVANRLKADMFVSVHINANRNRRVSGIEVYYPRESVVSSSALWPPSMVLDEIGVPSTTVKQVLWDMVLGRSRSQSRRLALSICSSMRNELQAPCRAVKPARFVVLREAWMPAVLVEVGYVSNQAESRRLNRVDYRQSAAEAIARGIVSYVRELGI